MDQNLGKLDRIFRFALGVLWLGPWGPRYDSSWANDIIAFIAWVALIESLAGWCWLHSYFSINNKNQ